MRKTFQKGFCVWVTVQSKPWLFWKISQNTGKQVCLIFFLHKVASLQPASLFKTRLRQKCFFVNFARYFRFWGTHPDAYCGELSRNDVYLHNLQNQFSEWKDKICQESIHRGNRCNSMIPLQTIDAFCRIRERKENNHIIFSNQPEKHPTWSPSILQCYQQLHHY